jgi:hypothetical protein
MKQCNCTRSWKKRRASFRIGNSRFAGGKTNVNVRSSCAHVTARRNFGIICVLRRCWRRNELARNSRLTRLPRAVFDQIVIEAASSGRFPVCAHEPVAKHVDGRLGEMAGNTTPLALKVMASLRHLATGEPTLKTADGKGQLMGPRVFRRSRIPCAALRLPLYRKTPVP